MSSWEDPSTPIRGWKHNPPPPPLEKGEMGGFENILSKEEIMQLSDFFEPYKGEIKEVTIGPSGKAVKLGGEKTLPFHAFEGK